MAWEKPVGNHTPMVLIYRICLPWQFFLFIFDPVSKKILPIRLYDFTDVLTTEFVTCSKSIPLFAFVKSKFVDKRMNQVSHLWLILIEGFLYVI